MGTDLNMAARLEDIRLKRVVVRSKSDTNDAELAYRETFRDYGVALDSATPATAAEQIRVSKVRVQLVAALDDLMVMSMPFVTQKPADISHRKKLIDVLRQADPDPWRNKVRALVESRDRHALEDLTRSEDFRAQPPATVHLMTTTLAQLGSLSLAIDVLRQAQQRRPGDFWINFALASLLEASQSGEAIAFFRSALAVRPESVEVHWRLGRALGNQGHRAEADSVYREALRLRPDELTVCVDHGINLLEQFKVSEAESLYRDCLRVGVKSAMMRIGLGKALHGQGKLAEAEAEYGEAIRQSPDIAETHQALADFLEAQDRLPEAEAERREAVRLAPANFRHHLYLGGLLRKVGKPDEAEAAFEESVRLAPNNTAPRQALDSVVWLVSEEVESREAVRLNPSDGRARQTLAQRLLMAGRLAEAESELLEAMRLQPENAVNHSLLGEVHTRRAEWDKAAAAFARSAELSPHIVQVWQRCAVLHLHIDDNEAYRGTCRQMLERFGKTDKAVIADQVAMTCLLGEVGLSDLEGVQELVEKALAGSGYQRILAFLTKALLDYRVGRPADATEALGRLVAATPGGNSNPKVQFVMSLAQQRLGNDIEARTALTRGQAMIRLRPPRDAFDLLCSQILCREAETLLNIDDSAKLKSATK